MAGIEDYRLADPEYTDFKPTTAGHAILRFRRLQKKGLKPWKYPEAMVECAASLSPGELAKFEDWIICPSGEPAEDAMDVSVLGTTLDEERLDMLRLTITEEEDEKMDPHNHVE